MATASEEGTRAWVPSKETDGEWLEARVVSHNEDGSVTLETDGGETHTQEANNLLLKNELPEEGVRPWIFLYHEGDSVTVEEVC